MSNPLWEYSTSHYALEGVAEICLKLQDEHGLDVNMLLYGAWLASCGFELERQHALGLMQDVARWRHEVVQPLRALRRQWKGYEAAEQLRGQLKSLELQAEQAQQDRMLAFYRANPPTPSGSANIEANLCLFARCEAAEGQDLKPLIGELSRLLSA